MKMNNNPMPIRWTGGRRNATTLIEVVGTMAVLLVLAISAAGILGSITEIGARNSLASQSRVSVQRLAGVFRDDVHQAREVNAGDDELKISLGDETVVYRWEPEQESVTRTVRQGDQPLTGDRFRVPQGCDPEFLTTDDMVRLVLKRSQPHPWVIEANR